MTTIKQLFADELLIEEFGPNPATPSYVIPNHVILKMHHQDQWVTIRYIQHQTPTQLSPFFEDHYLVYHVGNLLDHHFTDGPISNFRAIETSQDIEVRVFIHSQTY